MTTSAPPALLTVRASAPSISIAVTTGRTSTMPLTTAYPCGETKTDGVNRAAAIGAISQKTLRRVVSASQPRWHGRPGPQLCCGAASYATGWQPSRAPVLALRTRPSP